MIAVHHLYLEVQQFDQTKPTKEYGNKLLVYLISTILKNDMSTGPEVATLNLAFYT